MGGNKKTQEKIALMVSATIALAPTREDFTTREVREYLKEHPERDKWFDQMMVTDMAYIIGSAIRRTAENPKAYNGRIMREGKRGLFYWQPLTPPEEQLEIKPETEEGVFIPSAVVVAELIKIKNMEGKAIEQRAKLIKQNEALILNLVDLQSGWEKFLSGEDGPKNLLGKIKKGIRLMKDTL